MKSINPALNQLINEYPEHTLFDVQERLQRAHQAFSMWSSASFTVRAEHMVALAKGLRSKAEACARLMTLEMGKPIAQAEAEIEKCASVCDFYAEYAERFLQDEPVATKARKSFISFEPLGIILGIMPWNFPFWQVFRFIAPTLMAGNTIVLKHASNVSGCALAIENLLKEAGFPDGVFQVLLVQAERALELIADDRIRAVTLTGSETAGIAVGSAAGRALKKSVLELGGSDPYIVLEDADMSVCLAKALRGRLNNAGQSCIAAKRFIVMQSQYEHFCSELVQLVTQVKVGDPLHRDVEMGPLAKQDLVETLDQQVQRSIKMGATLLCGGARMEGPGFYYQPTVLKDVKKGMPAFDEETFGPVFAIILARNADHAIELANASAFGLGASLWTQNLDLADRLARRIQSGNVFINAPTVSDIHLPFGGVKRSGYGRELSHYGIKEFVNIKTISIN